MNAMKAALVVVMGTALAACQQTPEKNAADANAQALEKRIAALEQQTPPSAGAPVDPASVNLVPEPAAPTAYAERSAPASPARLPTPRR